jgi:BNR repeat-like domain
MQVAASGFVYDAREAPPHQRACAFTAVALLRDGTLFTTCRRGSQRESVDGHACVFASRDLGETWELRYDGSGAGDWDGTPGEVKTLLIAELAPGELVGAGLWVDRSGPPRPFVHPRTQGLLPMRVFHTISPDGGRTWGPRRPIDTAPHPGASPTGPPLLLSDGTLAQPYEHWKEYEDATPGRPAALLRLSRDGGQTWPEHVTVARDPANARFYWDQRLATQPETGQLVAMFWTHDARAGRDVDVHLAWGSPDGRRWSEPVGTGLPGQHCQPIPLGGERLVAVYAHRRDPPGIRAAISDDFGRTWDRAREVVVYASGAGTESGASGPRRLADYWDDMIAWRFGHPRGVVLPSGEVLVVFYGGDDRSQSVRWARLAV